MSAMGPERALHCFDSSRCQPAQGDLPLRVQRGDSFFNGPPHKDRIRVHRKVPAVCNLCQPNTMRAKRGEVGQRRVLLPLHEDARHRQRQKLVHRRAVVRKLHHRTEDAGPCTCLDLVSQARRIQSAGEGGCMPGALDEIVEEALGAVALVVHDLPAEETVLWRDIPFDVDEAQNPALVRMGQHQRRQPAHLVADEVEADDAVGLQHGFGGRHEEGSGNPRQITTV